MNQSLESDAKKVYVLEAIPDGFFSLNFSVVENNTEVARFELKTFSLRYKSKILYNGKTYIAMRVGSFPARYSMLTEDEQITIAKCNRMGIFKNDFIAEDAISKHPILHIHPRMFSRRETHEVFEDDVKIGSCGLSRMFTRKIKFETYIELNMEFRLFLLWFVLIQIAIHNSSSTGS